MPQAIALSHPYYPLATMPIHIVSRFAARVAGKLPLRTVLIVPFVVQIVGTVGLVGYLSFKSGQKCVEDLAHQYSHSLRCHNSTHIKHFQKKIQPLVNAQSFYSQNSAITCALTASNG